MPNRKTRREPVDLPTMVDGECDYCGSEIIKGRKYCSPECRTKYNNLCGSQGKSLTQAAKLWAATNDSDEKTALLDIIETKAGDFNREDKERKTQCQKNKLHTA